MDIIDIAIAIFIIICLASLMYFMHVHGFIAGDDVSKDYIKNQDKLIAELMKEHIEHLERESK